MGLVDYDSEEEPAETTEAALSAAALPPLPPAFHDLYAATVRTAPADDPSLHHGRRRAIPHVAGQWPSHLYIEWFPPPAAHARLSALLRAVRAALPLNADEDSRRRLHSFVTSDLGAPLPLHISLSRPFVLPTAGKDAFLARLVGAIRAANVAAFDVAFSGLEWYRGPDSARAFLVLRAVVVGCAETATAATAATADPCNGPLIALLRCCNDEVTAAGQPALYAGRRSGAADSSDGSDGGGGTTSASVASAFHVSIAWTLAAGVDAWADATHRVFEQWRAAPGAALSSAPAPASPSLRMHVDSVKAKIGNVVTNIPLATTGRAQRPCAKRARGVGGASAARNGGDSDAADAERGCGHRAKRQLLGP